MNYREFVKPRSQRRVHKSVKSHQTFFNRHTPKVNACLRRHGFAAVHLIGGAVRGNALFLLLFNKAKIFFFNSCFDRTHLNFNEPFFIFERSYNGVAAYIGKNYAVADFERSGQHIIFIVAEIVNGIRRRVNSSDPFFDGGSCAPCHFCGVCRFCLLFSELVKLVKKSVCFTFCLFRDFKSLRLCRFHFFFTKLFYFFFHLCGSFKLCACFTFEFLRFFTFCFACLAAGFKPLYNVFKHRVFT